ncbi:DNA polymerase thumb domain-containing protein [Terriglobus sp. ADX1]
MPGVGKVSEARLETEGIKLVGDIQNMSLHLW